jgi:hypothetical protein
MSVAGIAAGGAYQQGLAAITLPAAPTDAGRAAPSQFIGLPLPAPIRTALDDLSQALEKGDMHAAQTAFSNLVADLSAQYQSDSESSISLLG